MSGKRVVFCTFGSLGDLYPLLSLAREMKGRGHSPVVATSPAYRRLIEAEDIAFHPVRPDVDVSDPSVLRRVMDRRTGGRYLFCDIILPALHDSYEDTAKVAADADLLVIHPIAVAALLLARKSGCPWASVAVAPMSLCSAYDPPVFSGLPLAEKLVSFGPWVQNVLLKLIAAMFEPVWKQYREFEKELGLSPAPNPLLWGHSPHLALGLFSPILAAPQPDWPANAHATGFPFLSHNVGNTPELQEFLDSGEAPIVFTLGSAAVGAAGDFYEQSAEAAKRLGRRAVLLVGRDPDNQPKKQLPPGVIAVQYAPHSAIFPRACVNVHQGGIGTTGEAMRAGHPTLVVHYGHDQPDNAARLVRMGMARSIPRERYNADIAVREIQNLLENRTYAERAAAIGAQVCNENGTARACDLLSRLLETPNAEATNPQRMSQVVA
ncbi:MAG TPA: glycosyltransferase [Terriglobales bacterium]|nr:glycosyltransferase [Terriglobales bacterium]